MNTTIYLDCRNFIAPRLQKFVDTVCGHYVDDERIPGECTKLLEEWAKSKARDKSHTPEEMQEVSDAIYKEVCGIVAGPPPKLFLTKYDFTGPF